MVRRLVRPITDVRYPLEAFGEAADPALLGGRIDNLDAVSAPLRAGRGALLDRSGGAADLSVADEWKARVDVVTAPVADSAGPAAGRAVLVRPDGHVAWIDPAGPGEPTDVKGLSAALAAWFGAGDGEPVS
ncbi:hypothetical protein [Frankia sp. EI5c]|uniref:aromatic-ring hydroxylase C-terminal domain-containing protein n=1 Tax=Frankia sp. EI5c TaxID=683316 RepID=UPI0037BFBF75